MKFRVLAFVWLGYIAAVSAITALPHDAVFAHDPIVGVPQIVDGDTVWLGAMKIRLEGIDAPESDQICLDPMEKAWNCGISSRDELSKWTSGRVWKCHATGKDRYSRTLARCEVGGEDIQRWMVRNGWALSFVRYSRAYDAAETEAKSANAGIWAGAFVAPWDWRGRKPRTVIHGSVVVPIGAQALLISPRLTHAAVTPDCAIKGNVSRKGKCIFHTLGSRYYDLVNMDLAKGKRWFCTPTEAEAAGCRAAK